MRNKHSVKHGKQWQLHAPRQPAQQRVHRPLAYPIAFRQHGYGVSRLISRPYHFRVVTKKVCVTVVIGTDTGFRKAVQ